MLQLLEYKILPCHNSSMAVYIHNANNEWLFL